MNGYSTLRNGTKAPISTWTIMPLAQVSNFSFSRKKSYLKKLIILSQKCIGNYNQYKRGQKEGYLEIVNITYAETGTYECVVDTAVGKIKTTTNVIVHGPPGPPGGVSAVSLTSKSGTLIWTDGAIYGAEICFYRIEGRTQHNSTWVVLADMVQAENHELGDGIVIHGRREFFLNNKLSPYSSYEFRVAAYNKYSFPDTLACPTYYDANDPYNR